MLIYFIIYVFISAVLTFIGFSYGKRTVNKKHFIYLTKMCKSISEYTDKHTTEIKKINLNGEENYKEKYELSLALILKYHNTILDLLNNL